MPIGNYTNNLVSDSTNTGSQFDDSHFTGQYLVLNYPPHIQSNSELSPGLLCSDTPKSKNQSKQIYLGDVKMAEPQECHMESLRKSILETISNAFP